jgi:uncharacterized membrane protein YdfJ with MMPL/SSD domain
MSIQQLNKDLIRDLHVRKGSFKNIFIANIVTAFTLFGLLVASLVLLIAEGSTSSSKAIIDYFLSVFFFIAVALLLLSDMFGDIKTNSHFR